MAEFKSSSSIDADVKTVFTWHTRPGALERLMPPWRRISIVDRKGSLTDGSKVVMNLNIGPLKVRWVARLFDYVEGRQYCDEQIEGPFVKWVHIHKFESEGDTGCRLEDMITYEPPFRIFGSLFGSNYIKSELSRLFAFRHQRTAHDLQQHRKYAARPRLRIVVSGSTGLVGSALCAFLTSGGHRVHRLVRRPPSPGSTDIRWNPAKAQLDTAALEGVDAIIHLAGESIGAGRWTAQRKASIIESRVQSTSLLSQTIARLQHPPKVMISASAIGFYGNRGEERLDESSSIGEGFLAEVCERWERSALPVLQAGVRLINLRTGIVITTAGGALAQMLPAFRFGLGGLMGDGNQYMSWIGLDDLIGIINACLFETSLVGPVNAIAPHPVRNREFVKTLGRVLKRPAFLALPRRFITSVFGEMGQALLLDGAFVESTKLNLIGYQFLAVSLREALAFELGATSWEA